MKPIVQKLPLDEGASFVARTYETPNFEVPWHRHEALELILFRQSAGVALVGNHIGAYQEGDVFFFGRNLPHGFRKQSPQMHGDAVVVQFKEDTLGSTFIDLPEMGKIRQAMHTARRGIKLKGGLQIEVGAQLQQIESQTGFQRLRTLLDCLHSISISKALTCLTNEPLYAFSQGDEDRIGLVFEYSMQHFRREIKIEEMAALTNLSVSSFCRYFRRATQKTYIEFLNEIKVGHACRLLKESEKRITEICFESGFKSWANFSKQFKQLKGVSPRNYRQSYR